MIKRKKKSIDSEKYQLDYILAHIKESINDITRSNIYDLGLTEEAFQRRLNKRSALKKALKNCTYGSLADKEYVKDFIHDILASDYLTKDQVDKVIHFERPSFLSIQDKFEILLHIYKQTHGYEALGELIEAYHLDRLKYVIEKGDQASYIITTEEIDKIYGQTHPRLTYEDKLEIISQRIYQMYKGFGVVDEIRDMKIDGVSGGASGAIQTGTKEQLWQLEKETAKPVLSSFDSVWIFYKGKSIHLAFLSFESEKELRRICQNIYRYNKAGQLSEDKGFKINEMQDGSRVVVVRPSFSESWAFFVRKFHIVDVSLEKLLIDEQAHLPIKLLKYLVKGARITAITGSQGSGKTTLLMAMVREIYATLTLRVQETAFELHLRNVYPMRNILTFKETETITGQMGLDVQKKTDGGVNILGEVATDEVAVWMLQMAQVASLFTIFTHHAKTVKDLVLSLRNALLKTGIFRDEKIAQQQVASIIDFDVHLEKDSNGKRYISRISQIEVMDEGESYPMNFKTAGSTEEQMTAFMHTMTEFFMRTTDRKAYKSKDILVYDAGVYRVKEAITPKVQKEMAGQMTHEDKKAFEAFVQREWGDYHG